MRYETAAAFRQALEDRLRGRSRAAGSLVRLRKLVAFDRLLARLVATAPDDWALKGALALDFRFPDHARATKDMDLARADGEEAATEHFLRAQSTDLGDFFTFAIERTGMTKDVPGGSMTHYHVRAELAGRLFEEVTVDMEFSGTIDHESGRLRSPPVLAFADILPVMVPTLRLEQHLAEKVHAYTREYGDGIASTRPKDLFDILLIAALAVIDADQLMRVLRTTFERRNTHSLPRRFPEPPDTWLAPYGRLARRTVVPASLAEAHRNASRYLDPVFAGDADGHWDPGSRMWIPKKSDAE